MPPINFALSSNGGAATSGDTSTGYSVAQTIDGVRHTSGSYASHLGWQSTPGMSAGSPKYLTITTSQIISVSEFDVYSLADAVNYASDPPLTQTGMSYLLTDYKVRYLDLTTGLWVIAQTVTANNKVARQFTGITNCISNQFQLEMTGAPDGYGRVLEFEVWGTPASIPAPISRWSKTGIVPPTNLLAWHALDNAAYAGYIADYSGNSRPYLASSGLPTIQPTAISAKSALYFDGTNNPIKYSGSVTPKHIFIVAAFYESVFTTFRGLLSGISDSAGDLLLSNNSGDTFYNVAPSGVIYSYKKSDVDFAQTTQKAPMSGNFCVIEIIAPAGINMDGMQIGDQRNLGRKFKGWWVEDLFYGEVKNDFERKNIYRYFALKFALWRQKSDGTNLLNVFPFAFDRPSVINEQDLAEVSEAEGLRGQDKIVRYLADDPIVSYNLQFAKRPTIELEAARKFTRQHRLHLPFWVEDCEKNDTRKVTRISDVSDSGSGFIMQDYSFSVRDY